MYNARAQRKEKEMQRWPATNNIFPTFGVRI